MNTNNHTIKLHILFTLIFLGLTLSHKASSQPQTNPHTTDNTSWQRKFDDKDRLAKLIGAAGRETALSDTIHFLYK